MHIGILNACSRRFPIQGETLGRESIILFV